MPRASKTAKSGETVPSFEEALGHLETLVREMESDEIPLESLLGKYEEGTRLYRLCERRLDEARGRIEILRKSRNGEPVLEPFGDEAEPTAAESGALSNDGELF